MKLKALKYCAIFSGPIVGYFSLTLHGGWTWALPVYAFVLVPLFELFSSGNPENMSKEEEEKAKSDKKFDYVLWLMVPTQYLMMWLFLDSMKDETLTLFETTGRILTFGISCVVLGINVGHELGHRVNKWEQFLAKSLLLSTQYMHFFIEHNRGHHKRVATHEDPATARHGEWVYSFWLRSMIMGYFSAWELEKQKLRRNNKNIFSVHNEMLRYAFYQLLLTTIIYYFFGIKITLFYLLCSLIGILFLETVNYIEHYGLMRKKSNSGNYERVLPVHSWNSNHPYGRIMLFELTRHSDHHYMASRKYQILRHFDEAPLLPSGYPAMIMLALFPPLWFFVMHRHMEKLKKQMPLFLQAV
jgi:alkane 1-monooxygenase